MGVVWTIHVWKGTSIELENKKATFRSVLLAKHQIPINKNTEKWNENWVENIIINCSKKLGKYQCQRQNKFEIGK